MSKLLVGETISKAFGSGDERRNVLDGLSMEIADVAVMGASGSGKSTLLYALSGMDKIDAGRVLFEGQELSALSDNDLSDLRRKKMGFVFQQPTLLKNLNILDNILLPQMRDHRRGLETLTVKARALMRHRGFGAARHHAGFRRSATAGGCLPRLDEQPQNFVCGRADRRSELKILG